MELKRGEITYTCRKQGTPTTFAEGCCSDIVLPSNVFELPPSADGSDVISQLSQTCNSTIRNPSAAGRYASVKTENGPLVEELAHRVNEIYSRGGSVVLQFLHRTFLGEEFHPEIEIVAELNTYAQTYGSIHANEHLEFQSIGVGRPTANGADSEKKEVHNVAAKILDADNSQVGLLYLSSAPNGEGKLSYYLDAWRNVKEK